MTFLTDNALILIGVLAALIVVLLFLFIACVQKITGFSSKIEESAAASRAAWRSDLEAVSGHIQAMVAAKLEPQFVNSQLSLERALKENARADRAEMEGAIRALREGVALSLDKNDQKILAFTSEQSRRMENLTEAVGVSITQMRKEVDSNLKALAQDNEVRLEKIRTTVEDKLQNTLTNKVGESFAQVSQQLSQVYQGLGEMKELASDVGSLKRVLVNVKSRGMLGEVQLEALLSEYFTGGQFIKNAHTSKANSKKVVEFALRLPGKDGKECLLPIDAKFPAEDYQRLQQAADEGDKKAVTSCREALRKRLTSEAADIAEYIDPPFTTDFAIMFIPSEGLYAEALSIPELVHTLYSTYHVYMMGPSTLASALCAYKAGFQSLAIEKKSSEIRQTLVSVQAEFAKFSEVIVKLKNNLETATRTVDLVENRTRLMNRKLVEVSHDTEKHPESQLPDAMPVIDTSSYKCGRVQN